LPTVFLTEFLLFLQVNNAAVSFNEMDTNSVEHAETVLRTNFYGAKMLIEALLPLFRRSPTTSRILNLSSQLGLLNVSDQICNLSTIWRLKCYMHVRAVGAEPAE
jgi:NAD(P)-dependent dehydrogenase (short-subunit alcohol dehydrogenase family)